MEKLLKDCFLKLNIPYNDDIIKAFLEYKNIIEIQNETMNLTAIKDDTDFIIKHFADSVSPISVFDFKEGSSIIDVGTGAGFPGIPLKIVRNDLSLTLLDSLNKRVNFLEDTVKKLGLHDVTCIHARAEDGGKDELLRESFDIATSRAVADLSVLLEYTLPFVKVGGYAVLLKGSRYKEETDNAKNALNVLGGEIENVFEINLPFTDIVHAVIIIKKIKETPAKYPRKAGAVTKKPL